MNGIRTLSVVKFGGSLLSANGCNIHAILDCVAALKAQDGLGPIVVFSAINGFTDKLIEIGESCTQSGSVSFDSIFEVYDRIAKQFVKEEYLQQALTELECYRQQLEGSAALINKRFHGTVKAKVLTDGGELSTSVLMASFCGGNGFIMSWHKRQLAIQNDDNSKQPPPL